MCKAHQVQTNINGVFKVVSGYPLHKLLCYSNYSRCIGQTYSFEDIHLKWISGGHFSSVVVSVLELESVGQVAVWVRILSLPMCNWGYKGG